MRLPFQMHTVLYEVRSKIRFDTRRTISYKTLYNGDNGETNEQILRKARKNIDKKLKRTSGKLLKLEIHAVYT